jgi:hypothetical protein
MDEIRSLLNRPKAYCNIDGVGELGIGFMLLGYAAIQWLQVHSPRNSVWNQMYTLLLWVGLMSLIIHYGTRAIKKHITFPRTGFVEYRKRDTFWIPLILGAGVSALVSVGVFFAIRRHWNLTTPVALIGLVIAAAYAHGIARTTVRWKWVVVGVMVIGSLGIATLPADALGAVANHSWMGKPFPPNLVGAFLLTMTLYGAATLISGGISFWLFLRHTQPPTQES